MFYSRSYPTYILFYYISQQILKILEINDDIKIVFTKYASHVLEPIYPYIKKLLNIQFDIKFNYNCNLLEYLICCKINKMNSVILEEKKGRLIYVNTIKNLIQSGKYR